MQASLSSQDYLQAENEKTWVRVALKDFLHHWLADRSNKQQCITIPIPIVASGSISCANLGLDATIGLKGKFLMHPLMAPSVCQQI